VVTKRALSIVILILSPPSTVLSADGSQSRMVAARSGVRGGLVVCLGSSTPDYIAGLGVSDSYIVQALLSGEGSGEIDSIREAIRKKDVHGPVSVNSFSGRELPYANNLLNLVVVAGNTDVSAEEIMRVLTPLGAVMVARDSNSGLIDELRSSPLIAHYSGSDYAGFRKPWPEDMDEWTHWRHDAGGNTVSRDKLVGPPRHVQWRIGPMWQRHHGMIPSFMNMVSASGRLFYIRDEATMGVSGIPGLWRLSAHDAFNGKLLWKRDMEEWGPSAWSHFTESHVSRFNHPINIRERMVAVGDRVYVTLGFNAPLSVLDAATGKTIKTYEGSEFTDEIAMHNGVLYMSVNDRPLKPWPGEGVLPQPTEKREAARKRVMARDPESGRKIWESDVFAGSSAGLGRMAAIRHLNLTVADEGVFVIDVKDIVCLEPASGKSRWRIPRLTMPGTEDSKSLPYLYHCYHNSNLHTVVFYEGVLLVQHANDEGKYGYNTKTVLQALSPATGEELWRFNCGPSGYLERPTLLGIRGLVWVVESESILKDSPSNYVALDPKDGSVKKRLSVLEAFENIPHHHRCYPDKATEKYLILSRRGAEFVDLDGSGITFHHWARSGCRLGPLLANGLFYRLPDHCRCYSGFQPRGFFAFASEESVGLYRERLTDDNPLEKGPAFGTSADYRVDDSQWPAFRHDSGRSCGTPAFVPKDLKRAWKKEYGLSVSPPVIVDGTVYLSCVDEHRIVAIDAATGEEKWNHLAGARVDSPPTVYGNLLLYGARNGWAHCLRASDGEKVWSFRAAPSDRLIMAFDHIESPWPVNGSVLVQGGKVVFTAGHSSLLDGGVYLHVLDAETGELIEKKNYSSEQTKGTGQGYAPEGVFSGILVSSGRGVRCRGKSLGLSTSLAPSPSESASGLGGGSGITAHNGFFDSQWFNRSDWRGNGASGYTISCGIDATYYASAHNRGQTSYFIPRGATDSGVVGLGKKGGWLGSDVKYEGVTLGSNSKSGEEWKDESFTICPWALVPTAENLFVAGFVLDIDMRDPWAAFEGRQGGTLAVLNKDTGERRCEYRLDSPPVWNGMAAAENLLVVSCRDGSVVCFVPDK
jgi:outer membrane protein assembly factor BamB